MCGVQPTQPSKVKRCMSNQGGKAAAMWAVQHFHLPPCNPKKTFCSRLDGRKKKRKKGTWFDLSTESQQFASICVLAPCSSPVEVLASDSTQRIYGAQIQLIIACTEQDVFSAFLQHRGQGRLTQQEQCLLSRQNTPSIRQYLHRSICSQFFHPQK